jgi:hypothetical protein
VLDHGACGTELALRLEQRFELIFLQLLFDFGVGASDVEQMAFLAQRLLAEPVRDRAREA